MTYSELETRIQNHFENNVYYTAGDIAASIADGYNEVAAYTGCILKSVTVAFEQNLTYYDMMDRIPDLVGIIGIYNAVTKRWMIPVSLRRLETESDIWNTAIGTPDSFVVLSHRYMAISRKPGIEDYGNMYVYYRASAPSISGSTSFLIQDEHMPAVENYVISDLNEQGQEWTKADKEFKSYMQSLEILHLAVKAQKISDRLVGLV